jgi:hypothetical protein
MSKLESQYTLKFYISQSSNADAVDFVVLKHRWRWKQVEEEEDAETAEVLGISVAALAGERFPNFQP